MGRIWKEKVVAHLYAFKGNSSHTLMALVLSLCFLTTASQEYRETTAPNVQYTITALGNDIGLNSSDISALFQDQQGFIWIGTRSGISRFDGFIAENYTKAGNVFMGAIHSIVEDASGILWIGGDNGLFYYENGIFHSAKISLKDIRTIHLDASQKAWLGGLGFIPSILEPSQRDKIRQGTKIEPVPIVPEWLWNQKIGSELVWDIDTDYRGTAWLGVRNKRVSFDGQDLEVHWEDNSTRTDYIDVTTFEDIVFWGSERIGLILQKENQFEQITEAVSYAFGRSQSDIYFLTPLNLLHWKDGSLQTLYTFTTYKDFYSKKIIKDREGNFWIGGEGNLLKLTSSRFNTWSFSEEPLLNSNHSIAQLNNGKILIGSGKDKILEYKDNSFVTYTHIDVPHNSLTGAIHQDARGWVWYATSMAGITLERNGRQEKYTTKEGLGDNGQYFFYESSRGELWSGGDNGITRIKIAPNQKPRFENFKVRKELAGAPLFNSIIEGPDQSIWAASDEGLFKLEGEQLRKWTFPLPINPSPIITGMTIDFDGQFWISTQGEGLWQGQFDENNQPVLIKQWSVNDGLATDVLLDVLVDRTNRIWTAGQKGINYLKQQGTSYAIESFGREDGWLGDPTPHCKLLECDNGLLWSLGLTEISAFPLYHMPKNEVSPLTYITKVQLFDGKEDVFTYSQNRMEDQKLLEPIVLPHDKNFLNFHFTTTSYTQYKKNTFRYKLEGLDPDWNSPINDHNILYPGLQPGEYTFKVLAINNDGVSGVEAASFPFEILPPWYKSLWAYILYIAFFGYITYLFYSFKVSRKLAVAESERLKEVSSLKSSMYTNITHEFRTPLTVILGLTQKLRDTLKGAISPSDKKTLSIIERNGENLLDMVNEMLDLAKLENQSMDITWTQSNIVPLIKYLVESFHSLAATKRIALTLYNEEDTVLMDFDSQKISSILSNLLSNAIKFTPEGGKIIVHTHVILKNGRNTLEVKVKDSGNGIATEDQTNIFNRFYQVINEKQKNMGGTGIGLALCKELVELLGGTISVKSTLGIGSEFYFQLPITNDARLSSDAHMPKVQKTSTPHPIVETIGNDLVPELPLALLIEDNRDVAYYLESCLKDKYRTLHVTDGEAGIENAFINIPDIIICDVMMPKKDGYQVCKTLKNDSRTDHIPIIMLTAKVTAQDRIRGLGHGADAYLTKPFDKAELFTRIEKLILLRKKMIGKLQEGSFSSLLNDRQVDPKTKFIQEVVRIVLEHLDNPNFGSLHLASKLHLSESQIYRKIKAITDKSTAVFIRSVRLQKAKEMIYITNKSISEIAYEVGFNDPSWFSRSFKEEFGYPPSEIQK